MAEDGRKYHAHFVFNEKENDALSNKAKQCGLSKSAFIRRLILDKPVKARPPEILRDLYFEVNRIGVNINQIARSVNAGIATPEDAQQALFLLKKINELMVKVAGKT